MLFQPSPSSRIADKAGEEEGEKAKILCDGGRRWWSEDKVGRRR